MKKAMNITQISANGNVGMGEEYFYNMAEFPGGFYEYASGGGEGCGAEGLSNPTVNYTSLAVSCNIRLPVAGAKMLLLHKDNSKTLCRGLHQPDCSTRRTQNSTKPP